MLLTLIAEMYLIPYVQGTLKFAELDCSALKPRHISDEEALQHSVGHYKQSVASDVSGGIVSMCWLRNIPLPHVAYYWKRRVSLLITQYVTSGTVFGYYACH